MDIRTDQVKGYELHEQVGAGGFGIVYRASQPVIGRDVAIKVILRQFANHPEFIRRFEAEAQMVARLEHPHIVPLYDYWRDPDGAYLVMRWLRGGSLHDALVSGPLSLEEVAALLDQIAAALTVAHRRGVVHRDLKPANILLDEDRNAYLADFGIAKDLTATAHEHGTQPQALIGSPAYLSPEQIEHQPVTPQADIYSLGVMLYQLLTAELPFQSPTPIGYLFKHLHEPVPSLRQRRPDLPEPIDQVIQRATAKRPTDRYPDVQSLAADFRRALIVARPASPAHADHATILLEPRAASGNGNGADARPHATIVLDTTLQQVENPYKGLRPFEEADAADFFGREALTQHLLARMNKPTGLARFLAVVGPSGSGKSSVVRAGMIPALRRGALPGSERWFFVEMLPGNDPISELAAALLRVAVHQPPDLLDQLRRDDHGLLRVLDQILPEDRQIELVLLIDQFEELFTQVADEAARAHLLNSLLAAVTYSASRVRIIVTLRADFYDRPLMYAGFSELMRRRTEVVVPLSGEELERAIVSPAERVDLRIEPELVQAIVRDVGDQPGALPLLQYALTELFERREERSGARPLLTLAAYRASGGVMGALARRAEELYAGLGAAEQAAARQLFLRLVTLGEGTEDTRRRVRRSELAALSGEHATATDGHASAIAKVLEVYGAYRLLSFDHDPETREPTVEVAHEALIRSWGRVRQWLDESRDDLRMQRRLAAAAADWAAAGRDSSFLARGARLDQFATWAAESKLALTAEEQAYLNASLAERKTRRAEEAARQAREAALEQRSRRFLRVLVGVLLVATLGAFALTGLAFTQRRAAQEYAAAAMSAQSQAQQEANTRATAEAQARQEASIRATAEAQMKDQLTIADAQRLALAAQNEAPAAPETALLLAYEAVLQDRNPVTEQALRDIVDRLPWAPIVLAGQGPTLNSAALSPNGEFVVTGGEDGLAHIWDLSGKSLATLKGHTDMLNGVLISPDSALILTASKDGTARLWDRSGALIATLGSHTDSVDSIRFSRDGSHILTGSKDKTARLWDRAGKELAIFEGHTDAVIRVDFSPDGQSVLTASKDKTARMWDLAGNELVVFKGHNAGLTYAAFSPDGRLVSTAGDDSTARVWDLQGNLIANLVGHTDVVNRAIITRDGRYVLTSSRDEMARLWDLGGGPTVIFEGHIDQLNGALFSPDEQFVLTVSKDQTARLWDREGNQLAILSHNGRVSNAEFSPDGQRILTFARFDTARVWQFAGPALPTLQGHADGVNSVTYSPDGKLILTASQDGTARLWNLDGTPVATLSGHAEDQWVNRAIFSPDGQRVLTASYDGTARLWDLRGTSLATFQGHTGEVETALFSPDGKLVLTASRDKTARLWDLNGKQLVVFEGHTDRLNDAAFSPDGKLVLTTSFDKTARLWDLNGKQLAVLEGHTDVVNSGVFSPDGQQALTASRDGTARLWDLSGKQLVVFKGHGDRIFTAQFSPDGQRVVTASVDQTARLWDISGKQQAILTHNGRVMRAVFAPDGNVLSVSTDQTARLWGLDGKPLAVFRGHAGGLNSAAFHPDGKRLLTGANDATARQYLLDVNDLLPIAACRVGRGLTEEEITRFMVAQTRFDIANRQCSPMQ